MKMQLVITDVTPDEIQEIMNKLNDGEHDAFYAKPPVAYVAPSPEPHQAIVQPHPSQPPVTITGPEPEFDKSGLPWDERIHASTKTKTREGMWKKGRGVEESEIIAVEAELRAKYPPVQVAPPVPVTSPSPIAPAVPAPVVVMADPNAMFGQQPTSNVVVDPRFVTPAVVQPGPVPQPLPPVTTATVEDFATLMNTLTNLYGTQAIDLAYSQYLNNSLGVAGITDIQADKQKIVEAFAILRRDGKIQ